jgi:hypothetical protein
MRQPSFSVFQQPPGGSACDWQGPSAAESFSISFGFSRCSSLWAAAKTITKLSPSTLVAILHP